MALVRARVRGRLGAVEALGGSCHEVGLGRVVFRALDCRHLIGARAVHTGGTLALLFDVAECCVGMINGRTVVLSDLEAWRRSQVDFLGGVDS